MALLHLLSALVFSLATVFSLKSNVWLTTIDRVNLLKQQSDLTFVPDNYHTDTVIDVDDSTTFQTIDGFGASLTDSSAWLIQNKMNENQRENLLQSLFNASNGIGISILRQLMGSSDFSMSTYSYDDTCCDLSQFSIDYDKKYIIPILKRIRNINPNLLVIGSPYSPPGWMKTSGSMIRGRLKVEQYASLAEYFLKYITAYQEEGIPIYAVTIQNEPLYEPQSFPGMLMNPDEASTFIEEYLGPAFEMEGISTKILIGDHNWSEYNYALKILENDAARKYIAGTAFHCYDGNPSNQKNVHDEYPSKDVWMTECSDGLWIDGGKFESLFRNGLKNEMIGSIRHWARSVIKKNLALDEFNGPTNEGCNNCMGTVEIESSTGQVTNNPEYYSLGHVSKFVKSGAKRIQSTSHPNSVHSVAFKNQDKSIVLLAFNDAKERKDVKIRHGQEVEYISLDSGSAVTVVWKTVSEKLVHSGYAQIEAEGFSLMKGGLVEPCFDETGCGSMVGSFYPGSYLLFKNVDIGNLGIRYIALRIASNIDDSGTISFRLGAPNGTLFANIQVTNTGGWDKWDTKCTQPGLPLKGIHDLYLVFEGLVNFNWFQVYAGLYDGPFYKIVSRHSGKALTLKDNRKKAGTEIVQNDFQMLDSQIFRFAWGEGPFYKIISKSSGLLLEVENNSLENGARIQIGVERNETSQRWKVFGERDGTFKMSARNSQKSMDVKDWSKSDGAEIQQWDFGKSLQRNQLWILVPV